MDEAKYPRPRRKYSLEEIDRMREALRDLFPTVWRVGAGGIAVVADYRPDGTVYSRNTDSLEDALRTYMLNGTTPEELEAKVREREEAQLEEIARDVERETQRRTNAMLRKVFFVPSDS